MKDIIYTINEQKETLSKTEKQIAKFISSKPENCAIYSIQELATVIGVSEASVIRFCKKIGFKGYQELRAALKVRLSNNFATSNRIQSFCTNEGDNFHSFITKQVNYISNLTSLIDSPQFAYLVKAIAEAETVYLYCDGGASYTPIYALEFWLSRYGVNTKLISAQTHRIFDTIVYAKSEDIVLGFCFGKDTKELTKIIKYCKENNINTFLVTDCGTCLASSLTANLLVLERGPGDVFHSMSVPVIFSECLTLAVAQAKGTEVFETIKKLDLLREQNNV